MIFFLVFHVATLILILALAVTIFMIIVDMLIEKDAYSQCKPLDIGTVMWLVSLFVIWVCMYTLVFL